MDAANGVVQVATASAVGTVSAGYACPSSPSSSSSPSPSPPPPPPQQPQPQPPTTTVLLPLLALVAAVVVAAAAYAAVYRWYHRRASGTLDGPDAYPIVGTMYVMHGYRYRPFHRFTELARRYGPVYMMRMGGTPCAIVSGYPAIKEVLIANGPKFGGRFAFARYDALFNGDRNNSLALCDWSPLQETRRKIARMFCSPKLCSSNYSLLDSIASDELDTLLKELANTTVGGSEQVVHIKPLLLMSCANMFIQFMCTERFKYDDYKFQTMVQTYDNIFYDINQSYPVDFLPWLKIFYRGHLKKLAKWSVEIRSFIMDNIVSKRRCYIRAVTETDGQQHGTGDKYDDDICDDDEREPDDFTDALLMSLRNEPQLNMDHIVFELEDFIGGHSAVGNLVMIVLSMLATRPHVIHRIRMEAEQVTGGQRLIRLFDKPDMPYTEATLFETLRMISSPIVPRVATEDTTIAGHKIRKGTGVIINNFELNTSPAYWDNPDVFEPDRFVQRRPEAKPCIRKPEHFLPFSTGKRTCVGQQLVSGFGFVLVAGILQRYDVRVAGQLCLPETSLSLPPDAHPLILTPLDGTRRR